MKKLLTAFLAAVTIILSTASNMSTVYAATSLDRLMDTYVGTTWNGFYYGSQCKGFANYIFYQLWDVVHIGGYGSEKYYIPYPSGAYEVGRLDFSTMSKERAKNLLLKGLPGDFIQVRRRGQSYGHSMILVSSDAGGITVFDCNSDGRNGVKKYYVTWQQFYNKNSAMSLYRANNNTGSSGVRQEPSFTVNLKDGAVLSGTSCPITGTVKNGGTYPGLHLYVDYGWAADTANNQYGNYAFYLDTTKYSNGSHKLGVKLTNEDGYDYTEWFNITINNDKTAPVIRNAKITNVTAKGYTVSCTVTDNVKVDRVQFPTWTSKNGQDDIIKDWYSSKKASGTKSGNTYTYRVNIADHNNEIGLYNTHIYAIDAAGNQSSCGLSVTLKAETVYYGDLDKDGKISVNDLAAIKQAAAGQILLTSDEKKRADLNGDGRVNAKDVTLMRQYIVGTISKFPVEG